MEKLVFIEKSIMPNDDLIITVMKNSYPLYGEIFDYFKTKSSNIHTEWKYYGKKNGWLLKHFDDKRNIFFLVIYEGYFKISFTFGDKVVREILDSDSVSNSVKVSFENAKKYVEGTTILYEVKSKSDVDNVKQLIRFKMDK
jgi:hypothetical protein